VLGVSDDATIDGVVRAARQFGGRVCADMIAVADPADRGAALVRRNVDLVCVHTAFDRQASGANPLEELAALAKQVDSNHIAVAGGVDHEKIHQIARQQPAVVVVGGAIAGVDDPRGAAVRMRAVMEQYTG